MSDINIDAIADSLNNKVDLPSIATSQDDIDFVVEWQKATADNDYTWYRKYKSGWVEQGGRTTTFTNTDIGTADDKTVSLPVTMLDSNYSVTTTRVGACSGWSWRELSVASKTTTAFIIKEWTNAAASGTTCYAEWKVSGMAA